ncbi:hypothetical protein SLE2022_124390 [Rubroshorea leprosula]
MKQGNLETLVSACAGGTCDRKIACETLATAQDQVGREGVPQEKAEEEEIPPDFPPESFWLSKDAELDWFDRNAFYERKESQKGNSVSNSANLNPNLNRSSNSSSQRFLKKSKASIIGLPKPQKSCYVDAKNWRNTKAGSIRLFPKRSGSANKSDAGLVEPSSPKVSCMGRVRSKRDRNRRLKNRQKSTKSEKVKKDTKPERRRTGFFSSFRAMFGSHGKSRETHAPPVESPSTVKTSDIRKRLPPGDSDAVPLDSSSPPRTSIEAVGLGGMKRFASGRRSEPLI